MRILIIHRSFALVGGAERVIIDKANYLSDQGHDVMLVSYEQGQHPLPYVLQQNVKFIDLDCRFFTLTKYSVFWNDTVWRPETEIKYLYYQKQQFLLSHSLYIQVFLNLLVK